MYFYIKKNYLIAKEKYLKKNAQLIPLLINLEVTPLGDEPKQCFAIKGYTFSTLPHALLLSLPFIGWWLSTPKLEPSKQAKPNSTKTKIPNINVRLPPDKESKIHKYIQR